MKRFAAVFIGGLGFGALLRRRRRVVQTPAPAGTDSLAEELRAKLAESRATAGEPAVEEPSEHEPEPSDLDSRRRDVHDRARHALDELG